LNSRNPRKIDFEAIRIFFEATVRALKIQKEAPGQRFKEVLLVCSEQQESKPLLTDRFALTTAQPTKTPSTPLLIVRSSGEVTN